MRARSSVVPFQTSFSAVSARRRAQRVPDRLARALRRVRRVAQARARPPPPRGRSRACASASGAASATSSRWRSSRTAAAGLEERLVPEPELGAGRLLLADGAQQAVALLERPAVGRELARRRPATAGRRAGRAPPRRSDGDPATSSISSGANRTVRRTPASAAARRATPLTRIRLRAPPVAVRTSATSTRVAASGGGRGPADARLDPRELLAPADELALGATCGGSGPRRGGRSPRGGSSCPRRSVPTTSCGPGSKAASSAR